jgi:hypothetical protein
MTELTYDIRYNTYNPHYYCFICVNCGQNITVFFGTELYREVKRFEAGESRFETLGELHTWALKNRFK